VGFPGTREPLAYADKAIEVTLLGLGLVIYRQEKAAREAKPP